MKYSNRHISDEELDQLFRDAQASEGQESLFVPEFWSEMEAMLPAEKKSKRGFYWIPLAATALLVSLLLFYPSNRAQIDRFQKQAIAKNDLNENEPKADLIVAPVQKNQNVNSFKSENSKIQNTDLAINNKPQAKTAFKTPKKRVKGNPDETNDLSVKRISPAPIIIGMDDKTPKERTELVVTPKSTEESTDESDFTRLEPRQDQITHDGIAALPKKPSNESNQWYLELGPTIGQSPYMSPNQKRNVVGGAVLGGGYTKRIDNAFVSFGLQARMEGFGGLNYQETNFSTNIVRKVSVKQLYSIDIPLKFGYSFKKSEISFGVTPGIQLFVHGKEQIMQNQVVQREDSYTGKVEHSNSLSMEFGFQYYYNLSSKYSIGAKVNADVLRPFHTDYYLGKLSSFPVNGQIVIRRTFSK
jgi:hypothetical protein